MDVIKVHNKPRPNSYFNTFRTKFGANGQLKMSLIASVLNVLNILRQFCLQIDQHDIIVGETKLQFNNSCFVGVDASFGLLKTMDGNI